MNILPTLMVIAVELNAFNPLSPKSDQDQISL